GILITIAYDETIASAPADAPADAPASAPARAPQNRIEKEIYKEKEITVVSTTVDTHPPKPTIDEIQQYITDKGYTDIDAEAFWNFYESKNWMIGKNKMSKWKSAIATWHRKNLIEQKQKQNIKHTDNDTNQIDSQNRRLQDALLSTYYSMLGSQEAPRNEGLPDVPDILLG
ncbi:MAG: hypothetical protein MJZ15_06465, partial [Bacteroidales bacterium]|nr:hypothetical protein [Bacteroidales bacterium]